MCGSESSRPRSGIRVLFACVAAGICFAEGLRHAAVAQTETGDRWAVVVGVGQYTKFYYGDLKADNDAEALHALLTTGEHAIPAEQALLLTTDAAEPTRQPTRANILTVLSDVAARLDENDVLFFFFAGHGVVVDDHLLLLVADTYGGEESEALRNSALPYAQIKAVIDASQARAKITIMDACHSGTGRSVKRMPAAVSRELIPRSPTNIVLASCSTDEQSWEHENNQHGAYTWFLLAGLGGAADGEGIGNGDGAVSLKELWAYVQVNVPKWAQSLAKRQTPQLLSTTSDFSDFKLTFAPVQVPSLPEPTHAIVPVSGGDWPYFVTVLTAARDFTLGPTPAMLAPGVATEERRALLAKVRTDLDASAGATLPLQPFDLSTTLVTNAQYAAFVSATGYRPPANGEGWDEGQLRPGVSRDLPVTMITYEDAAAYCEWLSGQIKRNARMPMAHEWQYAARAGNDAALYAWGSAWPPDESLLDSANRLGIFQVSSEYSEWCYPKIKGRDSTERAMVAKDYAAEEWYRRSTVSLRVAETTMRHPNVGFRVLIEK